MENVVRDSGIKSKGVPLPPDRRQGERRYVVPTHSWPRH
jgi:hypothetical protein